MTAEMREKISQKLKGFKRSPETIAKMRIAQKLNKSHVSKETGDKIRQAKLGKKPSKETRRKMGLARIREKNSQWKGGITPLYLQIRHNFKSRQWVSDCFFRDDFTCQDCGVRGGKLHCHHLKLFSQIIKEYNIKSLDEALACDELWNINNGITLCKKCHSFKHKKNADGL